MVSRTSEVKLTSDLPQIQPDLRRRRLLVNDLPGGYWKHELVDHVLLVNVYFPPPDFYVDLARRLPELVRCYPSPHWQLAEWVGEVIGQDAERIIVGNGIAEMITALIGGLDLSVAVPTPSFNPYEQVVRTDRLSRFALHAPDFELDVDAFAEHVVGGSAEAAVVISPNNPTSRAVRRASLVRLAERLAEHGKRLIIDESFVEFLPDGPSQSLENEVGRLPNLVIFKSLGKIYGVCGLRLGYMLTSDHELIRDVRRCLPIWNVNTLGEYFITRLMGLQIEAERSWRKIRRDRDQLFELLSTISGMTVLRPHANFVFCRLPPDWPDGPILAERVLADHSILVRHNGGKTMHDGIRYLRVAARSPPENERLVACIQEAADACSVTSLARSEGKGKR